MLRRWAVAGTLVVGAWLGGGVASAQTSDADWLADCKEHSDRQARYCEVRPVSLMPSGVIRVDARPNGGISMTGADQANVTGSARIQAQADTEAEAKAIAAAVTIDSSAGTLRASGPETGHGRSWSVTFVLSAPRRCDVQVETVNGPVGITGISGQIRATTTNGPLSLKELAGDVRARTTNGPLTVVLNGRMWEGQGLDAETQNGPLRMAVPDGYSAQIETGTVNGPFSIDIPVTVQGLVSRRSVKGTIGGGGSPIRAVTHNGPVSIDKR